VESIGVGVVGFWHVHANDYARDTIRHPDTALVGGWDPDPETAREGAAVLGIELSDTLDELLARPDIDAVTVTTATSQHTDVIRRAIRAGKHVFTEKLLAATVEDCEQLAAEAREAGVALVVSLPRLSEPYTVATRELIRDGALGELTYARVRMAHDGWLGGWLPERFGDPEQAIGGAFSDLGCHPAYLVQLFLGDRPTTVTAAYSSRTGHAVEDNAVVTSSYAGGALGVAEASFVTTPGAFAIEVRGTEATLLYGLGRDALAAKGGRFGDVWTDVPLPEPETSPFELWVDAIHGRADAAANVAAAIELTRLVVAANRSAAEGRAIPYDIR
jgi:1,5-anhydro-D-fructose reductase (1,5-anhydro-D-mannitol-forming)